MSESLINRLARAAVIGDICLAKAQARTDSKIAYRELLAGEPAEPAVSETGPKLKQAEPLVNETETTEVVEGLVARILEAADTMEDDGYTQQPTELRQAAEKLRSLKQELSTAQSLLSERTVALPLSRITSVDIKNVINVIFDADDMTSEGKREMLAALGYDLDKLDERFGAIIADLEATLDNAKLQDAGGKEVCPECGGTGTVSYPQGTTRYPCPSCQPSGVASDAPSCIKNKGGDGG